MSLVNSGKSEKGNTIVYFDYAGFYSHSTEGGSTKMASHVCILTPKEKERELFGTGSFRTNSSLELERWSKRPIKSHTSIEDIDSLYGLSRIMKHSLQLKIADKKKSEDSVAVCKNRRDSLDISMPYFLCCVEYN